jgi:hypothetical protein
MKISNNVVRLLSVVGTTMLLAACGSQPSNVRIRNNNPFTGDTEVEYRRVGPPTHELPSEWSPDGERTVDIEIDGDRFTIRLCIARNTRDPNCIYINSGGCDASDGWRKYCRTIGSQHHNRPPSAAVTAVAVASEASMVAMASAEIFHEEDLSSPCPDERGSVDYNPLTGVTSVSFVTACGDEQIPEGLVDVMITGPDGVSLPSDVFNVVYGAIPSGSLVQFSGGDEVVAWNSYKFHRTELSFTSTSGQVVQAAIKTEPSTGIPIAIVAIDGQIHRVMPVTRPE